MTLPRGLPRHHQGNKCELQTEKLAAWDSANRLKLVVQLRRFLVPEGVRRPNLASQCLGLARRRLQDEWEKQHGFRPLLCESFHDPAVHQGTLYKVTNWTPLGFTKGLKRHRADFYQDLQSPKQLWIRPQQQNAQQLLGQPGTLPEEHRQGIAESTCGARSALSCNALRSLKDAFNGVDDPRNPKNRRHPLRALLGMLTYGLLCGAPDGIRTANLKDHHIQGKNRENPSR